MTDSKNKLISITEFLICTSQAGELTIAASNKGNTVLPT